MARLPIPGGDINQWGDVLNQYLLQAHNSDGTLRASAVQQNLPDASTASKGVVQLAGDLSGSASAPTVPALGSKITGSGVAKITVASTAPSGPAVGDIWIDTSGT